MIPPVLDAPARRALGRLLTQCARDGSGRTGFEPMPEPRYRIGVTGAPGSGKSSLIGVLASRRVEMAGALAVLAIDPTSPVTQGSVLGDRIRMDAISTHPGIYIRSLPSRSAFDGLCDNVESLLRVLERSGFVEIILETVGAGQVQHTSRTVTDTLVMVHSPHAGDAIQAMKAGLMEMADIFVVNKADLPDASRAAMEIRSALLRDRLEGNWRPPVILTSTQTGAGIADLSDAIDRHRDTIVSARGADGVAAARVRHHAAELLTRRLAAAIAAGAPSTELDRAVASIVQRFDSL
ncbi:MAG: ArgK/MeaB family GTPase [Rhizobiaceae bacterium]